MRREIEIKQHLALSRQSLAEFKRKWPDAPLISSLTIRSHIMLLEWVLGDDTTDKSDIDALESMLKEMEADLKKQKGEES